MERLKRAILTELAEENIVSGNIACKEVIIQQKGIYKIVSKRQ